MTDFKSIMGYAYNSPFRNSPYLDIQTPEGSITMENTPIDLLGIDNLGNAKRMKAGSKKDYKFPGTMVREIPVGNPYQMGGLTNKQLFDFLFDDEEEEKPVKQAEPTAPTVEDVDMQGDLDDQRRRLADEENDMLAMSVMMEDSSRGNPYMRSRSQPMSNPYTGEIISTGQFGNKNVGEYGKQIYGQLASHLGYAPAVNSIYRSKAQNDALIAKGKPAAKNSWHLTGNAIDLKPTDWHKLSNEQQLFYRTNYDVIYHDNHYHIEPK